MLNPSLGNRLVIKILGMLLAFFLVALAAIGLTLFSSWQIEGVAAAINDAGSLRMRSWKLAHQLTRLPPGGPERTARLTALNHEMSELERVQEGLERGDPERPLFIPRDDGIPADLHHVGELWRSRMKPLLERGVVASGLESDPAGRKAAVDAVEAATASFVDNIDRMVHKMEISYAHNTTLLRSFQVLLVALAVIGTVIMMRFFFVAVVRPLHELQKGMKRMEEEDLSVRVPVLTDDEFGELSRGFNGMAGHLQNVYATLEERVESKTRILAEKNRDLNILYNISRLLGQPGSIDELSQGFLERVRATFGASAASVRLFDGGSENLYLTTHAGLDGDFVTREAVLRCGECVCGQAMLGDIPVVSNTGDADNGRVRATCTEAGFATVSAIPVNHNKRTIGIFNLYFSEPTPLRDSDREVLQSLGQHLGMAVENLRLQSREREMAVSEERNLIARELHDSIAQGLAFLNLQVQVLERSLDNGQMDKVRGAVAMIHRGVQESYGDVRELLQHFRARFDQTDLDSALRAALEKFTEQSGVPAELKTHGLGAPFDPEIETQVLYIVQEALSNARKHAQATRVRVDLWRDRDGMRLTVTDDGVGFEQAAPRHFETGEHVGLNIMGERAARIGGNFLIRSRPGQGTQVSLDLKRNEAEHEPT